MRKVFVGGTEVEFSSLRKGISFEAHPSQEEAGLENWKEPRRFRAISEPFHHEGVWAIQCEELK